MKNMKTKQMLKEQHLASGNLVHDILAITIEMAAHHGKNSYDKDAITKLLKDAHDNPSSPRVIRDVEDLKKRYNISGSSAVPSSENSRGEYVSKAYYGPPTNSESIVQEILHLARQIKQKLRDDDSSHEFAGVKSELQRLMSSLQDGHLTVDDVRAAIRKIESTHL